MSSVVLSATALLVSASAICANLDLAHLYTQTVKQGTTWASIDTKVETLDMELEVNHGVVTTTATFSYTPSNGMTGTWSCVPVQCIKAPCPDQCESSQGASVPMDSLETSSSINLEDNGAITDMYLWVGDVKVRAELQTRALASAQYEDIVKRRKDPALIETWGSGYYSLRIFPEKSGQTRKLQIKFTQGMEDDKGAFSAILPIMHSLAVRGNEYYPDQANAPHKSISKVNLKAISTDGKTYTLNWPGLGEGKVGPSALSLSALEVKDLKAGTLSGTPAACAGCLTPWTSEQSGSGYFGVKTVMMAGSVKLQDQPKERCVILDVDASDTQAPERARKLALLALKAYGQAPYTANLALSDGKGNLEYVFDAAVTMEGENLNQAFAALKAWKPVAKADAHAVLQAFAYGRKGVVPVVAFLINNDPYEYFQYPPVYDEATIKDVEAKARAYEETQATRADLLAATLKSAKAMLFGYWNDWHLTLAAQATGGFNLGSINGWLYTPYYSRGGAVDLVTTDPAQPVSEWTLPPLFGPGRPDAYGMQDLKVTVSGMDITDLVVLQNASRMRTSRDIILMKTSARGLAKSADYVGPWYGSQDSIPVRIGGRFAGTGKAVFTLTGMWGGLRFTQQFSADLNASGAAADGGSIWAYQQTEAWGRDDAKDDIAAMQKLGNDYHVVNRQISLLALEPGMSLWTDMPAKPGETGGAAETTDMNSDPRGMAVRNGMNMDSTSLEAILAGKVSGLAPKSAVAARPGALSTRAVGGGLELAWEFPASAAGERARFRILDVNGRTVADISSARSSKGFTAKWPGYRPGMWLLRAESGRTVMTKTVGWAR